MATLPQLIQHFWPGGTLGPVYGQNEGVITEQGVDVLLPAGHPVTLPEAGTLVWSNGYQAVFKLANGLYNSFTHIVAGQGLTQGQTYQAGTQIGTVSGQTGWPLHVGNYTYYSSAPHIEYGIYSTLSNAIAFVQGINPATELNLAEQKAGNGTPGGTYFPGTGPGTTVIGGIQQWINDQINKLDTSSGTIPGTSIPANVPYSAVPGVQGVESAISQAGGIGYGLETVGTWLGKQLFRWVIVILLALAMLVVLDQLLTHGQGMKTIGKAAVLA